MDIVPKRMQTGLFRNGLSCLLTFLLCLLTGRNALLPAGAQQTPATNRYTATLPFAQLDRAAALQFVSIGVDDRMLGTFVIDTGAWPSLLEANVATKLGLTSKPAISEGGAQIYWNGKPADAVTLPNCKFGIGTLPPLDIAFALLPENSLTQAAGQRVDGILGSNVFEHVAALFDFQHQQITLWYPGSLTGEELNRIGMGQAVQVPLSFSKDSGTFTAPVRFNGTGVEDLIVDTGVGRTLISSQLARQLKLQPVERGVASKGVLTTQTLSVVRVRTLSLAKLTLSNISIGYSEQENALYRPRLGLDVLTRYLVLIDFPQKKMFLKSVTMKPAGATR
jgi:predicted aspartyl protease